MLCLGTHFSYPPHSDVYIFALLPQSNRQIIKIQKVCSTCCTSSPHPSSEGNPSRLWQNIFQHNQLPRFHVRFIKLFSSQLNDQTDSESIINSVLLHLLNQKHSLHAFHDQNNFDAEKLSNEVINVFIRANINNSPDNEVSPKHNCIASHIYFSSPRNFSFKSSTYYSSLKFDADGEFSSKNDTLQVEVHLLTTSFHTLRLFNVRIPLQ